MKIQNIQHVSPTNTKSDIPQEACWQLFWAICFHCMMRIFTLAGFANVNQRHLHIIIQNPLGHCSTSKANVRQEVAAMFAVRWRQSSWRITVGVICFLFFASWERPICLSTDTFLYLKQNHTLWCYDRVLYWAELERWRWSASNDVMNELHTFESMVPSAEFLRGRSSAIITSEDGASTYNRSLET